MSRIGKIQVNPEFPDAEKFILSLPERFAGNEGQVIYEGRNTLRKMDFEGRIYVVKSFHSSPINRLVYGTLRKSKAERSYINALLLRDLGVPTPCPIGFMDIRKGASLSESYYVSLMSSCKHIYSELFDKVFDCEDEVIRLIGTAVARMHSAGLAHKDLGRGNILFGRLPDGNLGIDIIDLNRMSKGKIGLYSGCKNFERLPANEHQHRLLAESYAKERGFDADLCFRLMRRYRSVQPAQLEAEGFGDVNACKS